MSSSNFANLPTNLLRKYKPPRTAKPTDAFVAGNAKKGAPNRKQAKSLEVRRADYSRMITDTKKSWLGYRRPGSNTK